MFNDKICLYAMVLVCLLGVMVYCVALLPRLESITAVVGVFIPIILRVLDKAIKVESQKKGGKDGRESNE